MKKLKVGDKVYAVSTYWQIWREVERVGRKWVYFTNGDKTLIGADYINSAGRSYKIYESQQDYIEEHRIQRLRAQIKGKFDWSSNPIDPDKVKAIHNILFGEVTE